MSETTDTGATASGTMANGTTGALLITGASSGIGRACAQALARRGARLLLTGRDETRLEAAARDARAAGAHDVAVYTADFADLDEVAVLAAWARAHAPLAGIVHAAGFGQFGPSESFPVEAFERLFRVNVAAPFLLSRELLAELSAGEAPGTIVHIGSDASEAGFAEAAGYCASKGALKLLGRALREEWREKGVRIIGVEPGRVDTCFNGKAPGMRPGALTADAVAEIVAYALAADPILELQEISVDSMARVA